MILDIIFGSAIYILMVYLSLKAHLLVQSEPYQTFPQKLAGFLITWTPLALLKLLYVSLVVSTLFFVNDKQQEKEHE